MAVRETLNHTFKYVPGPDWAMMKKIVNERECAYGDFMFCSHSWEDCAMASWKKWPNPRRPDVLCVDIINKEYDEETGVLKATRLMMLKSWVPAWLQPLAGNNVCFFVEESITDPKNKRLILKGKNLTFKNLAEMEETCIYTEGEDGSTLFEQEGAVTAYTFGLARRMEKFCLDRFRNASIQVPTKLLPAALPCVHMTNAGILYTL